MFGGEQQSNRIVIHIKMLKRFNDRFIIMILFHRYLWNLYPPLKGTYFKHFIRELKDQNRTRATANIYGESSRLQKIVNSFKYFYVDDFLIRVYSPSLIMQQFWTHVHIHTCMHVSTYLARTYERFSRFTIAVINNRYFS